MLMALLTKALAKIIWAGVFQYCVMRVLMTIVAVATQSTGVYCAESLSPAFAHVWVCSAPSPSSCATQTHV